MIERGLILRAFFALFILAILGSGLYGLLSDTDGQAQMGGGDSQQRYGPIFEDPTAYRTRILGDRWVNRIPLHGGATFGQAILRQVRIDIDGAGPLPDREVTLQTRPAVEMFSGDGRERAEDLLHGIERLLEDRGGLIKTLSLTESKSGFEAAAIASFVEQRLTDGVTDKLEQKLIQVYLSEVAAEQGNHAYAWYSDTMQQVVLGPELSKGLLTHVRTPAKATPAENIFTAHVLRHELEHAVTPSGEYDARTLQWVEEGTADVLARWPGAAATTARELGMPYPKRYDEVEYKTNRGGYPEWTTCLRLLLGEAGVDWKDPKQIDEASELLQDKDAGEVPGLLADRIGQRLQLTPVATRKLEQRIRKLNGSAAATGRLVRSL